MWLGVDYYPEQWDPALLETDLDTIAELGCNLIRIAEFSWHLIEKTEGAFDFSFFDHVITQAKTRGLKIMMGTPTATIPAWLAAKHPDILAEWEDGQKRTFGSRHVYCFNSPVMYEYSEKIIRAMAEHYKNEEAIIAWQIDNELGHEGSDLCFCNNCRREFQLYLAKKFSGDISVLNSAYGTAFWSQEYNRFGEIPIPTASTVAHNPALRLDWERFRSESISGFADFQVRLLKEIIPNAVITHDFPGGGLEKHVDYAEVACNLDVVSYNNYPVWGGQKAPLPPHEIAFGLDYIRGLKKRNFWITEAIMGAQGHDVTGYLPRPNQAKMWSYQGMAHGCESLLYFRYRGASKGAEQFCYGILDVDNRKRRKFWEVQSFFADIRKYEKALTAPIVSKVAIAYDYDSLASLRIQRQSLLLDAPVEMKKLYKVFFDANVPVDVLPAKADFSGYKIVLLPQMIIAKPDVQARAEAFVKNGGILVLAYRTAVKDEDNNLPFGEVVPVGYQDLAGVSVVETESLQDFDAFPLIGKDGRQGSGGIFRDMLVCRDAEVLYHYGDEFYQEYAAVTRKCYGGGAVYYLGCGLDEATAESVIQTVIEEAGIETISSDHGVEVVVRGGAGQKIRMLINHNPYEAAACGVMLPAFGCKVETIL
ncbi:MAG: beta-galactosidase [Oscillibacter sp.]|nr:beta-galactosidase [Oscillibacter sp.]